MDTTQLTRVCLNTVLICKYMLRIGAAEFVFKRPAYKQPLDSGVSGQPPQKRARLHQEAETEAGKLHSYIKVFGNPIQVLKDQAKLVKFGKF
jgi:hypothetical protein